MRNTKEKYEEAKRTLHGTKRKRNAKIVDIAGEGVRTVDSNQSA